MAANPEFAGIETSYDTSSGEAVIDVMFTNSGGDTADIHYDAQFDIGANGQIDHEVTDYVLSVYTEGSQPFSFYIPESELPKDVEVCVQITDY